MNEDELRKKVKRSKVIICILLFIIIVLAGILVWKTVSFKAEDKEVVTEKNEEVIEENLTVVSSELLSFIKNNKLDALDAYGEGALIRVAINKICNGTANCKEVNGDEVKIFINNVFGKDATFSNVNCELNDGILWTYDSSDNKFVWNDNHPGHGGMVTEPIYTKINSIVKNDDKYVLVLNKLYYDIMGSDYITSEPSSITNIYDVSSFTDANTGDIDTEKVKAKYDTDYETLKDKGTKYRYTFVKNNNSYVLENYEILN